MNIDIIISADDIKEEKIIGKTAVVIDILRATSVITTAISNGARKVVPVETIEEARKIAMEHKENSVLGGERQALKIDGFDFSNSPLEYVEEKVKGKIVVMTTTNGTRAIKRSSAAKDILIGAMINAKAVVARLIEIGNDVVIVNSGTNGHFSIDDFICTGYMISLLKEKLEIKLTDIATTALYIYNQNKEIEGFIKYANHYNVIKELGLFEDLKYCTSKDIVEVVPEYKAGSIK